MTVGIWACRAHGRRNLLVVAVIEIFALIAHASTMLNFGTEPPMYFDRRLWQLTRGLRGWIALAILLGLVASVVGIARFAILGVLLSMSSTAPALSPSRFRRSGSPSQ